MATKVLELENPLYDYLLSVSLREPDILCQLREETANHPWAEMQISPHQGQFMAFLIQLLGAKKVLEIGVFTGYSSLAVALALPANGKMIACDISKKNTSIARRYWQKAGVADKIELRLAPALKTLDELIASGQTDSFDFVFIDADKENYESYYEKSLQLLRTGGLIAIDNVLGFGKINVLTLEKINEPGVRESEILAIRSFNEKLHHDERIALSLVPIADGLTLALKL